MTRFNKGNSGYRDGGNMKAFCRTLFHHAPCVDLLSYFSSTRGLSGNAGLELYPSPYRLDAFNALASV